VLRVEITDPGLDVIIRISGALLHHWLVRQKQTSSKEHDKFRFHISHAVYFYCVRCDYGDNEEYFANISSIWFIFSNPETGCQTTLLV